MRSEARPPAAIALGILVAATLTGCAGSAAGSPSAAASRSSSVASPVAGTAGSPVPSAAPTEPATPTPVPGAQSGPAAPPSDVGTTQTEWGTILDAVPGAFPVYPGAQGEDVIEGAASGAWISPAAVDEVTAWYRDALQRLGLRTVDLSDPLEDGSRVPDSAGDLPECRVQTTFRPEGGSTMITVLYGAGCAGAGG
jgi:hypothetical protein